MMGSVESSKSELLIRDLFSLSLFVFLAISYMFPNFFYNYESMMSIVVQTVNLCEIGVTHAHSKCASDVL